MVVLEVQGLNEKLDVHLSRYARHLVDKMVLLTCETGHRGRANDFWPSRPDGRSWLTMKLSGNFVKTKKRLLSEELNQKNITNN